MTRLPGCSCHSACAARQRSRHSGPPSTTTSVTSNAGSGGRAANLDDDAQAEVERIQQSGPWGMAAGMTYDDVIDPRELRNALIRGLELAGARSGR